MAIRFGKPGDIVRLAEILREAQSRSKYASWTTVNEAALRSLVHQSIQHMPARSCVIVSEKDGDVEGVVMTALAQLHDITNELYATDAFIYFTDAADKLDFARAIGIFEKWAEGRPKVGLLRVSVTDAIGEWQRLARFYEGRGYVKTGEIFEKRIERKAGQNVGTP